MESQSAQIARLVSGETIRNIIAKYSIGADKQNDPELLGPLFLETGSRWSCEGVGTFHNRDEIQRELSRLSSSMVLWSFHSMANPFIEVSDDDLTANAHWALWELATMKRESGEAEDSIVAGFYDAVFVKKNHHWFIENLELTLSVNCSYPLAFHQQ